jgi:2-keto-4-pentenoate hydratase/2-oxohepta-3-ene-1,7-dioic acid hydratase in catechol pathway
MIATGVDPRNLTLVGRLNGSQAYTAKAGEMISDFAQLVSYVSRYLTLEPGDVIFAGTAGQTTPIEVGDQFEVEISGVGTLTTRVVAAE